jgi:hypothetical protein
MSSLVYSMNCVWRDVQMQSFASCCYLLDPEDGDSTFLRNIDGPLPDCMASHRSHLCENLNPSALTALTD